MPPSPGDIALRILNHAKDKYADRKIHVQMLDINPEMLEEGKKRFARTMYHDGMYRNRIAWSAWVYLRTLPSLEQARRSRSRLVTLKI